MSEVSVQLSRRVNPIGHSGLHARHPFVMFEDQNPGKQLQTPVIEGGGRSVHVSFMEHEIDRHPFKSVQAITPSPVYPALHKHS